MSSVEKVSSVFFSTGQESVPLIDVFNDNDLQIKNSLVSKLSNLSNDAISTITSNAELLTRVAGVLITKDLGSFDLSSTGMLNIIDSTDFGKNLKGMTSSLTDKFKNGMNSAFQAIHLNPETALGVVSKVADEISYLPFTNTGNVDLTTLFLNKLSNNIGGLSEVVNMDWEYSVMSGTVSSMMEYGAGDIIDTMIDNYRSDYDSRGMMDIADLIINKVVKKTIQDVVMTGKLKNIKKHLQRIGVGEAVERYPNIARDILKYYRIPNKTKVKNYIDQLTLLEQTLDLADPNWYMSKTIVSEYIAISDTTGIVSDLDTASESTRMALVKPAIANDDTVKQLDTGDFYKVTQAPDLAVANENDRYNLPVVDMSVVNYSEKLNLTSNVISIGDLVKVISDGAVYQVTQAADIVVQDQDERFSLLQGYIVDGKVSNGNYVREHLSGQLFEVTDETNLNNSSGYAAVNDNGWLWLENAVVNGYFIRQLDNKKLYEVIDDAKLDSSLGYRVVNDGGYNALTNQGGTVTYQTKTFERFNLFTFMEASTDSRTILDIHPDRKYEVQTTIAREFPDRSSETVSIIKTAFPALILSDELSLV